MPRLGRETAKPITDDLIVIGPVVIDLAELWLATTPSGRQQPSDT